MEMEMEIDQITNNIQGLEWIHPPILAVPGLPLMFENIAALPVSNYAETEGLFLMFIDAYVDENEWTELPGPRYTRSIYIGDRHGPAVLIFNATVATAEEENIEGMVLTRRTIRRRQLYQLATLIHYRLV